MEERIKKSDRIVLASASPRRIEIFGKHGINAEIMPADIDETLTDGIRAEDAVMFLALKKALHAEKELLMKNASDCGDDAVKTPSELNSEERIIIVAADTVVFSDRILGKPASEDEAYRMLSSLRNKSHSVATGVAVIEAGGSLRKVFYDRSEVKFSNYSDEQIREYIATGEPLDKAGAYAIQGGFSKYVENYTGSFLNIVGFPWERFEKEMHEELSL